MMLLCSNFINSQPASSGYTSNWQENKVLDMTLSDISMSQSDSILWWRRVNGLKIPPPRQLFEIKNNISTGDFIHPVPIFHFPLFKIVYTNP